MRVRAMLYHTARPRQRYEGEILAKYLLKIESAGENLR
jgi:hypothetical protein